MEEKQYSNDSLSIKILNSMQENSDNSTLPTSSNLRKEPYEPSKIAGVHQSIMDLGIINNEPVKQPLKLKGLTNAERSDLVKEVLETPPSWLIKWGSTWALLVVIGILAISWFVQYPDLVKGKVQVTSNDIAKTVLARKDGLLEDIYIKDGDLVSKNQRIGRIESVANPAEIEKLKNYLLKLQKNILSQNKDFQIDNSIPEFSQLGEVQEDFQNFSQAFTSKNFFSSTGLESRKLNIYNQDLNEFEKVDQNLQTQLSNYRNDYKLANEEFQNQQKLHKRGLISLNELRAAESKAIIKKQQIDQVVAAFNNNQIQKNQKQQEILSVKKGGEEQNSQFKLQVNKLLLSIENWEKVHYLTAASDGKLIYLKNIQENQQLRSGENLFYIMPNSSENYGEMFVGQYNIGKIQIGQRVILKFDGYPYQEFGTMNAIITNISDIPIDSVYKIKVKFPGDQLVNGKKKVTIKMGMTATGEIVTEELRLIEKLFYEIRKYVKQ